MSIDVPASVGAPPLDTQLFYQKQTLLHLSENWKIHVLSVLLAKCEKPQL